MTSKGLDRLASALAILVWLIIILIVCAALFVAWLVFSPSLSLPLETWVGIVAAATGAIVGFIGSELIAQKTRTHVRPMKRAWIILLGMLIGLAIYVIWAGVDSWLKFEAIHV